MTVHFASSRVVDVLTLWQHGARRHARITSLPCTYIVGFPGLNISTHSRLADFAGDGGWLTHRPLRREWFRRLRSSCSADLAY